MTVELRWSRQARADLLDIYVMIGLDSATAAEAIYDRLEARVNILMDHPRAGPRRADIRERLRVLVESPYLILYEIVPDADQGHVEIIEIVRVVDGRRDLSTIV